MTHNQPSSHVAIFSGFASGATKLLIGHPFDTVKVRIQTQSGLFTGPLDCLRQTIAKEGYLALYKGASPPLVGWVMMDATQMGALTYFRTALAQNNPNNTIGVAEHAIAGLGAGLAVSFVASPIELIKAKLQVQYAGKALYKGPIDCIRQQTRGNVLGIYQGLSACLLFRSFFWCLWGSYEFYSRKLDGYVDPKLLPFFAGGLAGIFC